VLPASVGRYPRNSTTHGSRRRCSHRCSGRPPISGRCPTGPGCTASCAFGNSCDLLDDLNNRLMHGRGLSRRTLYEQLDGPALIPLPPIPYEYAAWKRCRVGLDYHVEIATHYYSVPHQLLRQEVEARITVATVETRDRPAEPRAAIFYRRRRRV
jgi:hypothetical protein